MFALTAVMLMMVSAGAVLFTCTDEAEAASTPYTPPYSFSQTFSKNIRSELPKTEFFVMYGDNLYIQPGAHDVWYGGWLNTKYERYVQITSVTYKNFGSGESHSSVNFADNKITGRMPVTAYGWIEVKWELKYSDHGSGKHVVEDSGTFKLSGRGPVQVKLVYDGVVDYRIGRDSVQLPHIPKEGHTHVGWKYASYDASRYPPGSTFTTRMVSTIPTLTAVYTIDYYTITFDSAGGSTVPSRQVDVGNPYGTLPTPTKTGYTFQGWYDGATKVSSSTVPTKDVTLKAQWTPNNIQYIAPSGNLAAGVLWSHQLSTTPGVSITVSGAATSWIQVSGGMLSGVPPSAGVYEVSVTLTAPNYLSQSQSFTLNVVPKLEVTNNPAAGAIAYVVI